MSERNVLLFVDDIIGPIEAIEDVTGDIEYDYFGADQKTYSATLWEFIPVGSVRP